jgi:hypothetical protein
MPIPITAYSVVIRCKAIARKYKGGWPAFTDCIPNRTACSDEEILQVSFMEWRDALAFVRRLETAGLRHLNREGKAADLAIIISDSGPYQPCEWLEFAEYESQGRKLISAKLVGGRSQELIIPGFIDPDMYRLSVEEAAERLEFLRSEQHVDVYRDRATGQTVYIGRTERGRPLRRPVQPHHRRRQN